MRSPWGTKGVNPRICFVGLFCFVGLWAHGRPLTHRVAQNPAAFRQALSLTLSLRCSKFFAAESSFQTMRCCHQAAKRTLEIMDFEYLCPLRSSESTCGFVVFRDRLFGLLGDPLVLNFIESMVQKLERTKMIPGVTFGLWEEASSWAESPSMAMEWVAVLFQDTSPSHYHWQWLSSQNLSEQQRHVFERLQIAQKKLDELRTSQPGKVKLFPFEYPKLATSIYHFYVISYLKDLMSSDSLTPEELSLSRVLPFLVNYVYEIQMDKGNLVANFLFEKKSFSPQSTHDVYAGYVAVVWDQREYFSYDEFFWLLEFQRRSMFEGFLAQNLTPGY